MKVQQKWLTYLLVLISAISTIHADPGVCTTPRLENATYMEIEEFPVILKDGLWEGQAYMKGGAARPRVGLVKDICMSGDLDGDGTDEQIAVLWQSASGTGSYIYIAVMHRKNGQLENTATALAGDRVKIKGGRVDNGKIIIDVLQSGENDAMCCPTQHATRRWTLDSGQLNEEEIELMGEHSVPEPVDG